MKRRRWNIFSNTSPLKSSGAPRTSRSWRTAHQPKACTPSIETPSHDALTRMAEIGDVAIRVEEFTTERIGHGASCIPTNVALHDVPHHLCRNSQC